MEDRSQTLKGRIDWVTTAVPFLLILLLCLCFFLFPDASKNMLDSIRFFLGDQLDNVDATLDECGEEIDAISDDLSDVEEAVFGDDEDDTELEDEDFFEIACPNCGEDLVIDDAVLEAGVVDCPACGQKFALSFEEGEEPEDDGDDE